MTLPTLKRDKNSPLKGSIKQKLFFQIVAILLLSAALILFVNSRLLSQVYIWREKDNLQQAARSINEMDQTQETDFRDSALFSCYKIQHCCGDYGFSRTPPLGYLLQSL